MNKALLKDIQEKHDLFVILFNEQYDNKNHDHFVSVYKDILSIRLRVSLGLLGAI